MTTIAGLNKKDAESRYRKNRPSTEGKKLHLEFMYSDPPFKIYNVEVVKVKSRRKK